MKSQLKWMAVGGFVSAGAGLLLGAAAFQPGLEPPAGQVSDTSPSLGEIDAKLDMLLAATMGTEAPNLLVNRRVTVPSGSADVFIPGSGESVRLVSVIVTNGEVDVRDASGTVVELLRANSTNAGSGVTGFPSTI